MHYTELFTEDELKNAIENKYVKVQKHPVHDLYIYNYTQHAQFDWKWDKVTLNCRGLILDGEGNIVARPLPKFFSYEQLECKLPEGNFVVQEKMDGSLGIVFYYEGEVVIATRGSFTSDQAIKAYELLPDRSEWMPQEGLTYLFEIIYPENRVVVDYQGWSGLVLLATVANGTGKEVHIVGDSMWFRVPKTYSYEKVEDMLLHSDNNLEGFVLKFEDGTRVKVKLAEYCRLHKVMTGVSEKNIWEALQVEGGFERLIERVPDEFFKWADVVREKLYYEYWVIESQVELIFKMAGDRERTRKEWAEYFLDFPKVKGILFNKLDGKNYSKAIWSMIKPKAETIFKCVGEDNN